MTFAAPPDHYEFPDRKDFLETVLVPLYVEPMDFSGERLCAGLVGRTAQRTSRTSAEHLLKYRCVYGGAVATLALVADLALRSLESYLAGLDWGAVDVSQWRPPASGISVGALQLTTTRSLEDALVQALAEHAAAVAIGGQQPDRGAVGDRYAAMSSVRLEREVRELVVKKLPKLEVAFGRQFKVREGARPLGLGFCGRRLIANFSALSRKQLSAAVRISKSKLWDLEQARDGAQQGWFRGVPQRFELLLSFPDGQEKETAGPIAEAFAELEFEADRKEIISRPMGSLKSIAEHLVKVESA